MSSQLWQAALGGSGGYMSTPKLSKELRYATQPLMRFCQFADVEVAQGKNAGDTYSWTVYGDTAVQGRAIAENEEAPQTTFAIGQASIVMQEYMNSVKYSGMYENLSEQPVKQIIHKVLKADAARTLDKACQVQFDSSILAARSTSATAFSVTETGTYDGTASNDLTLAHVKGIVDYMVEDRKIPTFDGESYICLTTPRQIRPFLNELENIHQYTSEGWARVMAGEKGKFENVRFVCQTNVSALTGQTGASTLGTGSYFFGADTVTEVFAEPLQIRGKIPDGYGRSKGIAWYYLGNYGITHANTSSAETKRQARIIKWRAK